MGGQGQGVGLPADVSVDMNIARFSACTAGLYLHVVVGQGVLQSRRPNTRGTLCGRARADSEVSRVNQPLARLARVCSRGDLYRVVDGYVRCRCIDKPAIATLWRAGIQRPCDLNAVILHIPQQHNLTFLAGAEGLCFCNPGVVDHGAGQIASGLGRQVDTATIGFNGTTLFDQRVNGGFLHLQFYRATEVEGDAATGTQQDIAAVGGQLAGIADLGGDQGDAATIGSLDIALIDDGVAGVAFEAVVTGHKVGSADIQGRSHDAADIDLGRGAEQNAIRVDQKHLAVGIEGALNHRDIAAQYPVERHRAAARLIERNAVAGTDGEGLPVDRQFVAALVDGHRVAVLADAARARFQRAAGGQCRQGRQRQAAQQQCGGASCTAFALSAGQFGNRDKGSQRLIPDQAVAVIEGGTFHRYSSLQTGLSAGGTRPKTAFTACQPLAGAGTGPKRTSQAPLCTRAEKLYPLLRQAFSGHSVPLA